MQQSGALLVGEQVDLPGDVPLFVVDQVGGPVELGQCPARLARLPDGQDASGPRSFAPAMAISPTGPTPMTTTVSPGWTSGQLGAVEAGVQHVRRHDSPLPGDPGGNPCGIGVQVTDADVLGQKTVLSVGQLLPGD